MVHVHVVVTVKGTMILVKENIDFQLISSKIDSLGCYIFLN